MHKKMIKTLRKSLRILTSATMELSPSNITKLSQKLQPEVSEHDLYLTASIFTLCWFILRTL